MSTGGVFTIIANDGKADKMIMATDLLRQRIEQVKCARRKARDSGLPGYEDDTPTLVDVERSHILYVNAHFKPFAAIGYEYQKVQPQNGVPQWSNEFQYSIPQFGDFFYDMVLHIQVSPASSTAVNLATAGLPQPAYTPGFQIGGSTTRTSVHSYYADVSGQVVWDPNLATFNPTEANVPAGLWSDYVQYCEFPAMRLLRRVQFTVNGNPLDEYNSDTYAFYEQFRVRTSKRFGWDRGVGQQTPNVGYSPLGVSSGGLYNQVQVPVVNGPQTPAPTQPQQDWWIKMLLWFNEDVRLSVPSVSIPYGQRFLTIAFAAQTDLVYTSGAGLNYVTETATMTYSTNNINNYVMALTENVVYSPTLVGSTLNAQTFNRVDLYINNIFVNPEIHDIYIKRIGFNLIRVHRIQRTFLNADQGNILLSQLKWPIEYFFAGVKPTENETYTSQSGINYTWRNWHRFVQCVPQYNNGGATNINNLIYQPPLTNTNLSLGAGPQVVLNYTNNDNTVTWWQQNRPLDAIQISAHQIPIYKWTPVGFFNSHIPLQYGDTKICTPSDPGVMLFNFCLYPGTYQPSGHFNISRAREFYFEYSSSLLSNTYTGNLCIEASSLNFLLISDGSAVLRYST